MNIRTTKFIVRRPGQSYAFQFHQNLCGLQAECVADRDATTFDDPATADEQARSHGLRREQFEVVEFSQATTEPK